MDKQRVAKELVRIAKELSSTKDSGRVSKRETRTQNLGRVFGEKLAIRYFLRQSVEDTGGPNDQLWWGNQKIDIDFQGLPRNLTRLIPRAYASSNVKAKDWELFIKEAARIHLLDDNDFATVTSSV